MDSSATNVNAAEEYLGGVFNGLVQVSQPQVAGSSIQVQSWNHIVDTNGQIISTHSTKVIACGKHFTKNKNTGRTV